MIQYTLQHLYNLLLNLHNNLAKAQYHKQTLLNLKQKHHLYILYLIITHSKQTLNDDDASAAGGGADAGGVVVEGGFKKDNDPKKTAKMKANLVI